METAEEGHKKQKKDLRKGDYVFFHTSIGRKKYITAYYVVDRVSDTAEASRNRNIAFIKATAKERGKPKTQIEDYKIYALVEDMLGVLHDEKSQVFYTKIAKLCPQEIMYRALSETKQDYCDSSIRKSRGAIFTEKIKRYAKEVRINLGLSSPKKGSITKTEKED